jgi:hydrogenase maturation protease
MKRVAAASLRIIALGNPDRGDDGAALQVASRFRGRIPVVLAGRPGTGLLDLMLPSETCILLDVTVSGAPPGTVHEIPLDVLTPESLPDARVSSHGFGPGEALALGRALGRKLPRGLFLGIEGEAFGAGAGFSDAVKRGMSALEQRIREFLKTEGLAR